MKTKFDPSVPSRSWPLIALALIGLTSLVHAAPNVSGTKNAVFPLNNDNSARPGDTITYTIGVSNAAGATDATGVQMADTIDSNSTFVNNSAKVSPNAIAHAYNAAGNTQLVVNIANGLLNGVHDIDLITPDASLVVTSGTFATSAGGAVTINADGSFTYTPEVGDQNINDTFSYTVTDGDGLASTGLVSINLGARVWYVDSTYAGANGTENGSNTRPFNALSDVSGASGPDTAGDIIFVIERAGDYDGGITLLNNQLLYGSGANLTVNTIVINTAGSNTTMVATPASTNAITLASGNTVTGFTIGNTTGYKIANTTTATVGTLTISNVTMNGTGGLFRADSGGALSVTIDSATTTSFAGNAIQLGGATTGTFTVSAGAISGVSGVDVLISGGTATINIAASISGNAGGAIEVTGHSTNAITFSGALNVTGGTGISIHNNTSGAITFSNSSKVFNTGASNAVDLDTNGTATVTFSNGGLDIDTTTGAGLEATGGGTIIVTGGSNTIDSVSATALNVANTTIGAGGLNFVRISSGNNTAAADPATGIILNNTGATAGLTVAGNGNTSVGGDDSGGVIQNMTQYGISLTSTLSPSFTNMNIHDIARNGVDGFDVTNFTFANGKVTTTGTASIAGDFEVSSIAFVDRSGANDNTIDGVVSITKSIMSDPERNGIMIETWAGTISNIIITNNTLSGGTTTSRIQDAIHVFAQGTTGGITTGTISNNTISDFRFFDTAPAIDVWIGGNGIRLVSDTNSSNPASVLGTNGSPFLITGNDIDNVGSNMIAVSALGRSASANVTIQNNGTSGDKMTNAEGNGISLFFGGNGTFNGLVDNNWIDGIDQGGNPSGSKGIAVQSDFGGNAGANTDVTNSNITVSNNNISNTAGDGIQATGINNAGTFNVRIVNNTVTTVPDLDARYGIRVQQSNVGTQPALNLEINGNTTQGAFNAFHTLGSGIGVRKQDPYQFGIEGLNPTPSNDPTGYINTQNPAGHGTDKIAGTGFTAQNVPLFFAPGGIEANRQVAPAPAPVEDVLQVPDNASPSAPSVADQAPSSGDGAPVRQSVRALTQAELDSAVATALDRWKAAGLTAEQLKALRSLRFEAADLPGIYLGEANGNSIRVSKNAGGNGWFVDASAKSDALFAVAAIADRGQNAGKSLTTAISDRGYSRRYTDPASDAAGRIDLLTTIMHEMGHAIGLPDSYAEKDRDSLMYGFLTKGERRLPSKGQAIGAIPGSVTGSHFLGLPVTIGTLNPGTTVTVKFDATVNAGGFCGNISNTANISGSNFVTVNTNTTTVPVHFPVTAFSAQTPPDKATVGFAYAGYSFVANGCPAPAYALAPGSGPLPGGFTLAANGALTAPNPSASGTFSNIIVRASNSANPPNTFDSTPFQITVAAAITFNTPSPLAEWTKDKSGYSQTISTSGGTDAITFSVSAGSLPNGLNLNVNTGEISGTPTVANTFNFTIKATDSLGANTSKAYQITINAAITVTPATLPNGQVGVAYSQFVSASGGTGAKTFSVSAGALPPPLVLNTGTGEISGTPTTPGSYNFTITATDTVNATGSQAYTIVIKQATTTTLVSGQNPSSNGIPVTFTATVDEVGAPPGTPTGTVTFFDGASPITCTEGGTAQPLNGSAQATCTTASLSVAGSPHSITAQYSGDANYLASTSNTVSQTVLNCANPATVTNLNDAGAGSLRQALLDSCPTGVVNFTAGLTGTITLTTGELLVDKNLTITGPGASVITVSGNNVSRVFEVQPGKTVGISGLTIANGNATGSFPANEGGGIFNDHSALTVSNCVLTGNVAADSGGGIFNSGFGSGSSSTVVKSCTFANNSAVNGGALYNYGDTGTATADILNSTFTNNSASGTGGAIDNFGSAASGNATLRVVNTTISANRSNTDGGGIYNTNNASAATASTTLTNVTITGNRADNDTNASGTGGGIRAFSGTVTLKNTIVSGNFNGGSPSTTADDVAGAVNADYSLFGNTNGATITGANNQLNVDPLLGALGNNGGPTQTHVPALGSLAINNGSNALLPADTFDLDNDANVAETLPVEQRGPGFPRVVNTTVDIGAVEVNYMIAATTGSGQSTTIGTNFPTALQATVSESGNPISGVLVTFTAPASEPTGNFAGSATTTATSDASGLTMPALTFTASNTAGGPYNVVASATNYSSANFALTNLAATTSMTTQVSTASTTVGSPVSDTATLSGGVNPTGTITFKVYGPNDNTCVAAAVFTSAAIPVNGNANYGSGNFTPTSPGTYRWIATYSGDANNSPIAGACNDANETTVVSTQTPTVTTTASGAIALGGNVSDIATIANGFNPTGTITFTLYGPNDATCSAAAVFTSAPVAVNGNGNYGSGNFTPTAPGTYRWRASYSGDANNAAVATACNDANESVVVSKASPGMTTTASAAVTLGGNVSDSATLTGGVSHTGTITFKLYGPNDATCGSAAVFTSAAIPVTAGTNTYGSGNFQPAAPGTYRWIATYTGDANNNGVTGLCNDANESVVVNKITPTISTQASANVGLGGTVSDTATLAGGSSPTGTITFTLFGPNNGTCSGSPVFTSAAIAVNGNANYGSGNFTPTAAGTYNWIATYSGDANNNGVAGTCGAANESVTVAKGSTTTTVTSSVNPSVFGQSVTFTATVNPVAPASITPTGTVQFTIDGNPAGGPITLSGNTAQFTTSSLTVAGSPHTVLAQYNGDTNYTSSNGTLTGGQSVSKSSTTTSVTSSANPSTTGQNVTFTATVAAVAPGSGIPTGTVQFVIDGFIGAPITLSNGTAQTSTSTLTVVGSPHSVIAQYNGDANFNTSNGSLSGGQTVTAPTPTPTPTPTATPTPTPTATPAQALNIATRLRVDIGDKVMIGGFIIRGNAAKSVVLRGMGPSLVNSGVPAAQVLKDPVLELRGPNGALIMSNDDWVNSPQKSQIENTPFQPTSDKEAVILATLAPGNYTAILSGALQTTGIGLVEIYDVNPAADSDLANISTRGFVRTINEVMIGGFTLGGNTTPTRIAVRALGPSLTSFGLTNVLADPTLELHNANGTIMISNDDWTDDPVSAGQLTANGLGLPNPKESGIFTALAPPGQFTAIVAGKNGSIGIALVEIYDLR